MQLCLLAATFALFGCNEYTAQICQDSLRVDVAGMEGEHTAMMGIDQDFNIEKQTMELKRTAPGTYSLSDGTLAFYTCNVNGKLLAESINTKYKTYTAYALNTEGNEINLTLMGFDKKDLDNSGVPYSIVERSSDNTFLKRFRPNDDQKQKALVVNNQSLSPAVTASHLHQLSYSLKLY